MVQFIDTTKGPGNPPAPPGGPGPAPGQMPEGAKQIFDVLETMMPSIERVTGLNRRDITLSMLKSGLRGNSLGQVLEGLMGTQEKVREAKLVTALKTGAIWIPIGFFLLGASLVFLIWFARLLMSVQI